ncbi:unnamed protein product [Victoria cruziana]
MAIFSAFTNLCLPNLICIASALSTICQKLSACFGAEGASVTTISPQADETVIEEPSSPSVPPQSTNEERSQFDVFLSFRGEDTRKRFTDHLFEVLKLRGVYPFRDSENLGKGEKIEKLSEYIEKSKICVPIISKGYADSKWCLKELAKIMECNKKVIPVFFEVNPSDVKRQDGLFASAFKTHESNGKLNQEDVRKWREALVKVGNISGFTLEDVHGYEAKLVNIIVKKVLDEVNPSHLDVGEYVIGQEPHLEKLMRVMDLESKDVRMIGIHGMGGIGKTTLAKAIYNKVLPRFEACSFISDVRSKSLETLQQQLLNDVFGHEESHNITNKSRGIRLITRKIGTKKVLIILDGVDSRDQLLALAGSRNWFKDGSRILITTRDIKPLIDHGVKKDDEIYELTGLSHNDSIKLFCFHAFRSENPPNKKLEDLCDEAVESIQGLPLALIVIGSQFFDLTTEQERRDLLEELKESQHKHIFDMLKLSYDSLDDNEKQVFLDIACFFIGRWEVNDVKQFWKECAFRPEAAINVLQHKALIKIVNWDDKYENSLEARVERWRFEMHDQIRDMGRKIVDDQEKEGKCSRLWKYDDSRVKRALQRQGIPSIEGIMLQVEETELGAPDLQQMDDLRLFHVDGATLEGFPDFADDLKWLGLPNCEHYHDPLTVATSIPRDHLIVLDLYHNNHVASLLLEECKPGRMQIFHKLKIIDLSCTSITATPDFTSIPCLVKLTLIECKELVEVHESVGQLKSLVWLNLRGCEKLRGLPDTICNLISLEFLSLQHCKMVVQLPKELGNLTSLRHLDLRMDNDFRSLPIFTRKLCDLENLFIEDGISGIVSMGDDECLVAASQLICSSASIVEALPDSCCRRKTQFQLVDGMVEELVAQSFISSWENLESLILNCRSLKSLPAWVGQLQKLKLLEVYSSSLTLVDDALPLESIEKLVLECVSLQHVSTFERKTENLKHLNLKCKKMETVPDWIGSSSNLETLKLRGCSTPTISLRSTS